MEEDLLGATAPFEPFESVEPFEGLSVLSVFKPVFLRRSSLKKGIAPSQYLLTYPILSFSVTSKRMNAFIDVQSTRWVDVFRQWMISGGNSGENVLGALETNDCVSRQRRRSMVSDRKISRQRTKQGEGTTNAKEKGTSEG